MLLFASTVIMQEHVRLTKMRNEAKNDKAGRDEAKALSKRLDLLIQIPVNTHALVAALETVDLVRASVKEASSRSKTKDEL